MYIPDNYDQWEAHDAAQSRAQEGLPKCGCCEEPIQESYYYDIDGYRLCRRCLEEYYKKDVEEDA